MIGSRIAALFRPLRQRTPLVNLPSGLSGSFELRVDRLVGSITDGFGTRADNVRINVMQNGALIDTIQAEPQRAHGRFIFSYPIDGRFGGRDLVNESVQLIAGDSDGNRGRLQLDGAAQLELLREHMGIPSITVLDLDFSAAGNARSYLGNGWSGTETDFTWTEDDDSFITFETPSEPGTYLLRMTMGAIMNRAQRQAQDLLVYLNEELIAPIALNEGHVQFVEQRFPSNLFGSHDRSTLRLHHPHPLRPCDLGPTDDRRRLAFNFKRLSLARLQAVESA
jgi:hypothetical protein